MLRPRLNCTPPEAIELGREHALKQVLPVREWGLHQRIHNSDPLRDESIFPPHPERKR